MKVDPLFDGWWAAVTPGWPNYDRHRCYRTSVQQFHKGDEYDIDKVRGFRPRREQAEEWMYRDMLESYWEAGMSTYADHCLGCGRWAKVLAFDDSGGGWAWRVTECKKCGMLDSRVVD